MTSPARTVPLHRLAHARAGDKGNRLNIAVFAYEERYYPLLCEQVTEAAVAGLFAARRPSKITRYDLRRLHGFNFVLEDVLAGGVNASLFLDTHGKGLSFLLLTLPIVLPSQFAEAAHER